MSFKDIKDKLLILFFFLLILALAMVYKTREGDIHLKEDEELVLEEELDQSEEASSGMVHIMGEVENPGVYSFQAEERLIDLVEKAGGLKDTADESKINLSMKLKDEMKINIPKIGENEEGALSEDALVSVSSGGKSNQIDINSATKEELMTLSGIGEKRAGDIIEYRKDHPFERKEDIKNISGIGDKTYEGIEDSICVNP